MCRLSSLFANGASYNADMRQYMCLLRDGNKVPMGTKGGGIHDCLPPSHVSLAAFCQVGAGFQCITALYCRARLPYLELTAFELSSLLFYCLSAAAAL
jgi:hypothetical protein